MISDKYGDSMTVNVVDDNTPKVETVNSFQAIVPLTGHEKGVIF
jgi:hypothetical protein